MLFTQRAAARDTALSPSLGCLRNARNLLICRYLHEMRSLPLCKKPQVMMIVSLPDSCNKAWLPACRAEKKRSCKADAAAAASSGPGRGMHHLGATSLGLAAVLLQPGAAPATAHASANWQDWYLLSAGVGVTCTVLTIWATTRFLLSL
jgi:hypothetical protein